MNPAINKFLVATATAIFEVSILIDGGVTQKEWLIVALSILGAIGVYAVPNASRPPSSSPERKAGSTSASY